MICLTEKSLSDEVKEKISLFCNIKKEAVIEAKDVESIYEIPLVFKQQGLDKILLKHFRITCNIFDLKEWKKKVVNRSLNPKNKVKIAFVGKYIGLQDAYKSVYEALIHGGIANDSKVEIKRVDSEEIEKSGAQEFLKDVSGVLVPGGFGHRGVEGKIAAIKYARENNIPYLGLCLGMQCAIIEFSRNACALKNANSTEFNKKTPYPVISLLEEQKNIKDMGGTMRLGACACKVKKGTKARTLYKKGMIYERHRHRYEFNNKYKKLLEKKGMVFSGMYPKNSLVEMVELKNHVFFIAVQFHPEFKSKPDKAHPLFEGFIRAALKIKR